MNGIGNGDQRMMPSLESVVSLSGAGASMASNGRHNQQLLFSLELQATPILFTGS